jgi:hypothetical protein
LPGHKAVCLCIAITAYDQVVNLGQKSLTHMGNQGFSPPLYEALVAAVDTPACTACEHDARQAFI